MTLWDKGRDVDRRIVDFTVGDDPRWDRDLVFFDCAGSVAHAAGLLQAGLLSDPEFQRLKKGLLEVIALDREAKFQILPEHEDVHTAVELYLTEKLGDLGRKLHTGRSRNDQVLTDLRLASKLGLMEVAAAAAELAERLVDFARRYRTTGMPGYTHMRKAMPATVGLWAAAFAESLIDDFVLLEAAYRLQDQSPLGSAAGFGSGLGLDRTLTARLLGFRRVQRNTLYAQNSRGKLELAVLEALGQIALDLNRLCSDLCLFSMGEFGYFELPEDITTGSSIMPQKRNPDVLELIRGKAHVLRSLASRAAGLVHNLPSGYNRDYQLTKGPLMEGLATCLECLWILAPVLEKLKVDEQRCRAGLSPELFSVAQAYGLVRKGVPFREAYRRVADDLNSGRLPEISEEGVPEAVPTEPELSDLYQEIGRISGWAERNRASLARTMKNLLGTASLLPGPLKLRRRS
jgi:argininosuccinate lyase